MSEARLNAEWDQTSQLLCLTANIYRPRGRAPYNADQFHPIRRRKTKKRSMSVGQLHEMRSLFPVVVVTVPPQAES